MVCWQSCGGCSRTVQSHDDGSSLRMPSSILRASVSAVGMRSDIARESASEMKPDQSTVIGTRRS